MNTHKAAGQDRKRARQSTSSSTTSSVHRQPSEKINASTPEDKSRPAARHDTTDQNPGNNLAGPEDQNESEGTSADGIGSQDVVSRAEAKDDHEVEAAKTEKGKIKLIMKGKGKEKKQETTPSTCSKPYFYETFPKMSPSDSRDTYNIPHHIESQLATVDPD